ncbi:sodium/hydrogen exchanger 9B2 [Manduca sexta]|uniref:sodium/hydrogen exchanger 9B2 n=1 Tax=Manduca sexta TaxID=7130 RepID=UPI00188F90E6|nr:sodium/hydrogen exchanger 9B2 [Manduca sexta]
MTTNGCETEKHQYVRRNKVIDLDVSPAKTTNCQKHEKKNFLGKLLLAVPTVSELKQYAGVVLCGLTLWGTSWFIFKELVIPGGYLLSMSGVVMAGYIFGHTLERYTTINSVVGMTLIGALYRNFGPTNYLNNPNADAIDFHLRRIYPVIILTKGPLSWNWEYIKNNSVKVFSLAILPWTVECLSTAFFTHILLDYPWYWGLHLGAILASVSPAVVVPTVLALKDKGLGTKNQIAMLVGNAGGLDTTLTEAMTGVINSAIFYPASLAYRIVKGALATFAGISAGVTWGVLCDFIPDQSDLYAPTVRSLLIFGGGVMLTYAGGYCGWGGASDYSRLGPCLRYDHLVVSRQEKEINKIHTSARHKHFRIAKLIKISAVLVRTAMDSLSEDATEQDKHVALQHSNIIVIAILITSTIGSVLTTVLGPVLLSQESRVAPENFYRAQTLTPAVTNPSANACGSNIPSL